MAQPVAIDRVTARRFLVVRHLLAPPRSLPGDPDSVMAVVDRLGSLQFDPLEIAGRNHDLVLLARIAGYRRAWTDALLYEERRLFEAYNKQLSILPTSELPWYRIAWDRGHRRHREETFPEHAEVIEELLDRIRAHGPLSSLDVETHAAIDWYWRPTNRVRALLEALAEAGILGISRRIGNRRYYDLIERLYPAELLATRIDDEWEQLRHKLLSRYRGHGLLGTGGQTELWSGIRAHRIAPGSTGLPPAAETRRALRADLVADGTLVPVAIEGVRGTRYVLGDEVTLLERAAREVAEERSPAGGSRDDQASPDPGLARPNGSRPGVTFLGPLDPFVWDRDFLRSTFGFDYVWEVYVPAAKRRWGYYVLPTLYGDRLVGRIEPRFDRSSSSLRVIGLWWEGGFDPVQSVGFVDALVEALDAHRRFGEVERIVLPRAARHRPLVRAIRERIGSIRS